MRAFKNQIIGVMRFAYPAQEGFAVSGLSTEDLEAHLYDPDRLARKFALMETITLPSLAGQSDMDFTLVILAGETMPHRYKKRLRLLQEQYAFLRCVFFPRMGALGAGKRAYRRGLVDGTTHVTGFRIDDDDAVAVDYVARTRVLADKTLDAGLADRPYVIAFSKGVYWDLYDPKAPFHEFREPQPLGLACAMITTREMETCIYRYNHRRLPCHVPTFMDPDGHMFLRTLHDHNDSGRKIPPHAVEFTPEKALKILSKNFSLDIEQALKLMPEPPQ